MAGNTGNIGKQDQMFLLSAQSGEPGNTETRKHTSIRGVSLFPPGSTPHVLGIDPGTSGAVSLLSATGDLLDCRNMPTLPSGPGQRDEISPAGLADIVREWQPAIAYVERVGPMPHDGAKQAFGFGVSKATIEAVLIVLNVRVELVAPAVWKRHARIPPGKDGDPKGAARVEATRRWPARADLFRRVKDHGRAESALIAACGMARGEAR